MLHLLSNSDILTDSVSISIAKSSVKIGLLVLFSCNSDLAAACTHATHDCISRCRSAATIRVAFIRLFCVPDQHPQQRSPMTDAWPASQCRRSDRARSADPHNAQRLHILTHNAHAPHRAAAIKKTVEIIRCYVIHFTRTHAHEHTHTL